MKTFYHQKPLLEEPLYEGRIVRKADRSGEFRSAFSKQLPEDRPVAVLFFLAVAPYGKVCLMRKSREQVEQSARPRLVHLGSEFALEASPGTHIV